MCCFGNIKTDSSAIYELHKRLSGARVKGSNASVSQKHNKKVLSALVGAKVSAEVSITFGDFCQKS